ncbi:hypothetical protein BDF19DRAFT_448969 [Syncephalis fuscata]|nr:hypothetical protein BDF19DRAFT_448969 [Syncephalis fuscata]
MLLLFKTLIPLLAIVEIVMGQTVFLHPKCILFKAKTFDRVESVCGAPIHGAVDHFCTDNQIFKMLEMLEISCKDELKKKHPSAWQLYESLLEYPLGRSLICTKDTDGSYCGNKVTRSGYVDLCEFCGLSYAKAILNWKPMRLNSFAREIVNERVTLVNSLIKKKQYHC